MSKEKSNINSYFENPLPIIGQIRIWILGNKSTDFFTKLTFNLNLIIILLFLLWNILGAMVFNLKSMVLTHKTIDLDILLKDHATRLSLNTNQFHTDLETYFKISLMLWVIILIGNIVLYRKQKWFVYLLQLPMLLYILFTLFYFNSQFLREEISGIDKLLFLTLFLLSTFYYFKLKKEEVGNSENFFGIEED
jgi:hypothetical protein